MPHFVGRPDANRSYSATRLLGGAVGFRYLVTGRIHYSKMQEIATYIKAEVDNVVGQ